MSKFIVDKINDRRIDIDLGGHWEALMNYINQNYPEFHLWPDKAKDDWILNGFEFGEDKRPLKNWLDRSYVANFSKGSKGYKQDKAMRERNDLKEIVRWTQTAAQQTEKFLGKLYEALDQIEIFMRGYGLDGTYITADELDYMGLSASFEIINSCFVVTFTRLTSEDCYSVAKFARKAVNDALVNESEIGEFYSWFDLAMTDTHTAKSLVANLTNWASKLEKWKEQVHGSI